MRAGYPGGTPESVDAELTSLAYFDSKPRVAAGSGAFQAIRRCAISASPMPRSRRRLTASIVIGARPLMNDGRCSGGSHGAGVGVSGAAADVRMALEAGRQASGEARQRRPAGDRDKTRRIECRQRPVAGDEVGRAAALVGRRVGLGAVDHVGLVGQDRSNEGSQLLGRVLAVGVAEDDGGGALSFSSPR